MTRFKYIKFSFYMICDKEFISTYDLLVMSCRRCFRYKKKKVLKYCFLVIISIIAPYYFFILDQVRSFVSCRTVALRKIFC